MNLHVLLPTDLTHLHRISFDPENIIRLEGVRNYTRFITTHQQPVMTCRSLGMYHERLPLQFIRVHKSHVINSRFIRSIDKDKDCIFMADGSSVPIARRKRSFILKLMKKGYL
ncbi:LytR/AlgR family response regulator transcription factor [Runella slithyformis]|uniref:LytR/AlgR family response regulator transcription factor n=1 Tax=Runella slithyformis TaxID=106 RepID=UPI0006942E4E|nr:LytTR family DNA-binding domain-containing protein [Runella slithyformis]